MLMTLVICMLSMNISIVKLSIRYELLDWKYIKLVLLILRDSLFNSNQEDILMSSVSIIDTSVLRLCVKKNKLASSAKMIKFS